MVLVSMVVGSAVAVCANIHAADELQRAEEYLLSKCSSPLRLVSSWPLECMRLFFGGIGHPAVRSSSSSASERSLAQQQTSSSTAATVTASALSLAPLCAAAAAAAAPVLADVAHLLLPALGPELAVRARALSPQLAATWDRSSIVALSRTGVWDHFLKSSPSMLELVEKKASMAMIRRTAELGFLSPKGADGVWAKDEQGRTPLQQAVSMRSPVLVRALLSARCPPDASTSEGTGWSPLMWAASYGEYQVCHELLQVRANVNALARDGSSPLLCATRADKASLDTVTILLAAGADPELVPMQSPFDEHIDFEVRKALAAYRQRARALRRLVAR